MATYLPVSSGTPDSDAIAPLQLVVKQYAVTYNEIGATVRKLFGLYKSVRLANAACQLLTAGNKPVCIMITAATGAWYVYKNGREITGH